MTDQNAGAPDYPITDRNKAKRKRERAHYDKASVYDLLDSALVCHIAYVVDGQPYCTPTLFWRRDNEVIWHGSVGSKMLMAQVGQEICLTVSFLDSIVLTRGAFHHAVNYRSVMLFGRAELIEDPQERRREAEALIDNFLPDRTSIVLPPEPHEMRQASFLKMDIDQAVAKIRNYPASFETEENWRHPVWAGEIPVELRIGKPTPCAQLDPAIKPSPDVEWYREGERLDEVLLKIRRRSRKPQQG